MGKQHAFHAQSMLQTWMISVTHAQWTSEPPLPLLLNDLYYGRISYTFHTFHIQSVPDVERINMQLRQLYLWVKIARNFYSEETFWLCIHLGWYWSNHNSTSLSVTIPSFPCSPSYEEVYNTFQDITSLASVRVDIIDTSLASVRVDIIDKSEPHEILYLMCEVCCCSSVD